MKTVTIALVGDRRETVVAHRCIPRALELASPSGVTVAARWIHTTELATSISPLDACAAVWLIPASPYASTEGALRAVQYAREKPLPFLGTCGGVQHAFLEFARNVAKLPTAEHAEVNPGAEVPLLVELSCGLLEQDGAVRFTEGSLLRRAYQTERAVETYHCRYGLNTVYRSRLEAAGLRFTAFDDAGDVRGGELPHLPFFVGTLFQPERSALRDTAHPLIAAFVAAAAAGSPSRH